MGRDVTLAGEAGPVQWYVRLVDAGEVADAELVRRIATRGAQAVEAEAELCRRFGPRARLYGLRHLRDEDRARDLAQAVLLVVLEAARAGRVAEHDKIDRFVLGTCRNVVHRLRERDARAQASAEEYRDVLEGAAAPAADCVDLTALMRCLGALDERARRVVLLSFHEERDAEEIAVILSTTSGNVRVLRHRALAALRRCLDVREEGSA